MAAVARLNIVRPGGQVIAAPVHLPVPALAVHNAAQGVLGGAAVGPVGAGGMPPAVAGVPPVGGPGGAGGIPPAVVGVPPVGGPGGPAGGPGGPAGGPGGPGGPAGGGNPLFNMWLGAPPPGMSLFDAIRPIVVPNPIPSNAECTRLLKLANQHRQPILVGLQVVLENSTGAQLRSSKKHLLSYFHRALEFREQGKKCIESFVARDNGGAGVTPAAHDLMFREFSLAEMKTKELDLLQKDVYHLFRNCAGLGVTDNDLKLPKQPEGGTLSWRLIKDHIPILGGAVLSTIAIKSPQMLNFFDWNTRFISWGIPGLSVLGACCFDSPVTFCKDVGKNTWETTKTVVPALVSFLPVVAPAAAGVAYVQDQPTLAVGILAGTGAIFSVQFFYKNGTAVKNDLMRGAQSTAKSIQNFALAYIRNGWLTGLVTGAGAGLLARYSGMTPSASWGLASAVYCGHASAATVARMVESE